MKFPTRKTHADEDSHSDRFQKRNCSGLVSPSTPRVAGARIVGNSD